MKNRKTKVRNGNIYWGIFCILLSIALLWIFGSELFKYMITGEVEYYSGKHRIGFKGIEAAAMHFAMTIGGLVFGAYGIRELRK